MGPNSGKVLELGRWLILNQKHAEPKKLRKKSDQFTILKDIYKKI